MLRTRHTPIVALLIVCLMTAPVAGLPLVGSSDSGPVIQQNFGHDTFIVDLENDSTSADAIQDWANASSDRHLIDLHNETNSATVAAPAFEIHSFTTTWDWRSLTSTQITDLSYVEGIHPNYRLSLPADVEGMNVSEFAAPEIGLSAWNDPALPTQGMAFDGDVDPHPLGPARDALGGDNVTASSGTLTRPLALIDTGTNVANGQIFGNGTSGSDVRISNASRNFVADGNVTVASDGFDAIEDGNGHGTWVSAAAAANASNDSYDGMAPDANLLVLKALADDGSGSTSDIATAVRYAADHDARVIGMSLGSHLWSQPLADAIDYAYDNGVQAVVVAAGNSRQTARWIASPADAPGVVTVGATNASEPSTAWSARFSQIGTDPGSTDNSGGKSAGAGIDIAAPGYKVTASVPTTAGYTSNNTLSGTSMSQPFVAGGIYRALAANSTLKSADHDAVLRAVNASARPVPNAGVSEVGNGMFAVDLLISGDYPETEQADARTDAAANRDLFYEALSNSQGGTIAKYLPFGMLTPALGGVVGA